MAGNRETRCIIGINVSAPATIRPTSHLPALSLRRFVLALVSLYSAVRYSAVRWLDLQERPPEAAISLFASDFSRTFAKPEAAH
jgi:hypothetical protein